MSWSMCRFQREMHKFDPLLRIRRSLVNPAVYLIERKAARESVCLVPPKERRSVDSWVRDRDGYIHVMKVHHELLNQAVFLELRANDMWQFKKAGWYADQLEAAEAAKEVTKREREKTQLEACADETYENLAWREGRRVAISR